MPPFYGTKGIFLGGRHGGVGCQQARLTLLLQLKSLLSYTKGSGSESDKAKTTLLLMNSKTGCSEYGISMEKVLKELNMKLHFRENFQDDALSFFHLLEIQSLIHFVEVERH